MTHDEKEEAKAVRETAMLIANTLSEAEAPFGVALAALTMVLTKAAIECGFERFELMSNLESAIKMIYESSEKDNLTGGEYVQ